MIKVRLEQLLLPEHAMQAIILSVSKDSFLQSLKMDLNVIKLHELPETVGYLSYSKGSFCQPAVLTSLFFVLSN